MWWYFHSQEKQESLANATVSAQHPCTKKTDFDMKQALKVIHFAINYRPTRGSISPCNIVGLSSNVSEDVATQIAKHQKLPSSTTPLSSDTPAQGNPCEYLHMPYISGNQSHWATFLSLIVWVYLQSFSRGCLPKMRTRAKFRENLNLQQLQVIQSHRFWYKSKVH